MSSSSLNYPLLAIPAYYVFSLIPHGIAMNLLSSNGYQVNNASPKQSLSPDAVKGKVPDAIFHKYQRAESAQANNMEQLPYFAAAVLASLLAERTTGTGIGKAVVRGESPTGLNTFVATWFAIRTLYVAAYIQIADHSKSRLRSLLWAAGSGLVGYQIYKAASLLG